MKTLRSFLDALEEGVIFLDRERRVAAINRAASRMIDQDYEAVIGQFCPSIFNGTECAEACTSRNYCSLIPTGTQQTRTLDLALNRPGGSHIVLRMWAILLPEEERLARYAIILRDRTREAMLEMEVGGQLPLGGMVGHSPVMKALFRSIMQAASSDATVLIQGESGTGKEFIAKALHNQSARREAPYVKVHCASFPENLLESELFGYAKGAFTGAQAERIGRFEAAHGGTLLLDEIGEISLLTQVKLLRVLQEKEVERLGENKPRKVDVRIIAATNRNLATMVREGTFRKDLYYRLNVLPIQAPPLRNRQGDILLLSHFLMGEIAARYGRESVRLSHAAMTLLDNYTWPGNVRELANVLECALVHAPGNIILAQHFPKEIFPETVPLAEGVPPGDSAYPSFNKTTRYYHKPDGVLEKERVMRMLLETGGNKVLAAHRLGMSRTTLWKRIKEYGLDACDASETAYGT